MSKIRAILLGIFLVFGLVTVASATHVLPANAAVCRTPFGFFYMEEPGSPGFRLTSEGHNQITQMHQNSSTYFCLSNTGVNNWFMFIDQNTGECLNVGSDMYVYEDSCINSTPERWNQANPGDHEWENGHYGFNGMLWSSSNEGDKVFTQPQCTGFLCPPVPGEFESWATPAH